MEIIKDNKLSENEIMLMHLSLELKKFINEPIKKATWARKLYYGLILPIITDDHLRFRETVIYLVARYVEKKAPYEFKKDLNFSILEKSQLIKQPDFKRELKSFEEEITGEIAFFMESEIYDSAFSFEAIDSYIGKLEKNEKIDYQNFKIYLQNKCGSLIKPLWLTEIVFTEENLENLKDTLEDALMDYLSSDEEISYFAGFFNKKDLSTFNIAKNLFKLLDYDKDFNHTYLITKFFCLANTPNRMDLPIFDKIIKNRLKIFNHNLINFYLGNFNTRIDGLVFNTAASQCRFFFTAFFL